MTKVEQKFQVKENSQISDIYSKLNHVQKKAIVLFDTDRNGTMDAKECKAFNNSVFSEQANGDLDVYLQLSSGKQQKTTVKQDEFDHIALSLERTQTEREEIRDGKKVNVKRTSDSLKRQYSPTVEDLIKEATEGYETVKKLPTDKNGNTKYLLENKYTTNAMHGGETEPLIVNDYVILDKNGHTIERKRTNIFQYEDDPDFVDTYANYVEILHEDKVDYYGVNMQYVGSVEDGEFGDKYTDASGNILYYQDGNKYYDEKGKLKCSVTYNGDLNTMLYTATIYDDQGKVKAKITTAYESCYGYGLEANELDKFVPLLIEEGRGFVGEYRW